MCLRILWMTHLNVRESEKFWLKIKLISLRVRFSCSTRDLMKFSSVNFAIAITTDFPSQQIFPPKFGNTTDQLRLRVSSDYESISWDMLFSYFWKKWKKQKTEMRYTYFVFWQKFKKAKNGNEKSFFSFSTKTEKKAKSE